MFLFWSGFSSLLLVVIVAALEESDVLVFDGSLVMVISRLFGRDAMIAVLRVVSLEDELGFDASGAR